MTKYLNSKLRILGACQLQCRLARQNYLGAERDIARMEMSREHLRAMAGQMLENQEVVQSAMLAAKMELAYRLIALNGRQKGRIMEDRQAAALLQSEAVLSARKEDRAAQDLKQARKSSTHRQQQSQPCPVSSHGAGNRQLHGRSYEMNGLIRMIWDANLKNTPSPLEAMPELLQSDMFATDFANAFAVFDNDERRKSASTEIGHIESDTGQNL